MLKNLTILALAGALLPACIITSDNSTDGVSASGTGSTGGTGTGTDGTGTDGTDSGATDATAGDTTAVPTTGEPTSSTGGSTDQGTTDASTGGTTGSSGFGMCGWNNAEMYYGCAAGGADPGVSDPQNMDAIECPEGLVEGEPCSDQDGPVTNIGCCAANGDNYYCEANKITVENCGA